MPNPTKSHANYKKRKSNVNPHNFKQDKVYCHYYSDASLGYMPTKDVGIIGAWKPIIDTSLTRAISHAQGTKSPG